MRGTFPGEEFVGIGAEFIADDGVETGDDTLGLGQKSVDSGGVFDAFVAVAVFSSVTTACPFP